MAQHQMNLDEILFLFLAGAGVVMTLTLAIWHQKQNGNRRIASWIIWVQAIAWVLFLSRFMYVTVANVYVNPHPPVGLYLFMVTLMDAGHAGHIWSLIKKKEQANGS